MTTMEFKPATRRQLKVKIGLMGTAGTGKTWNALAIAEALVPNGRVAVIDSERGRAEAYAGDFKFDHMALPGTSPETYIEALSLANDENYDVIVVDSISHEWVGKDGILQSVDRFGGWKDATPRHDEFVHVLFGLPRHVICTIRAKTQYLVEETETEGGRKKQTITKLGVGPVQRDNLEYEFDLLGMCELDHSMRLHKSVIANLPSGSVLEAGETPRSLGRQIAYSVREWFEQGEKIETPVDADDQAIGYLVALLGEEGYDALQIQSRFRQRRLQLGALTPDYVATQTQLAEQRLLAKGITSEELDQFTRAFFGVPETGAEGAESAQNGQNGGDAGSEPSEADSSAESLSEASPQKGKKADTLAESPSSAAGE